MKKSKLSNEHSFIKLSEEDVSKITGGSKRIYVGNLPAEPNP